jgi:formylmethanofuran dehydrogenase subunit E
MTEPEVTLNEDKVPAMIRSYTFEEFADNVKTFHGFAAIGVIIGGFMVDCAYRNLPSPGLFDALCETSKCLPDAIQLLTPCTLGNGWLTVINIGRYALTLYNKETGEGIRVFIDPVRLEGWPDIKNWFFKLKPKEEQDNLFLMKQVKTAGTTICSMRRVRVAKRFLERKHRTGFVVCPRCEEAYPVADGLMCIDCQGEGLYEKV